MRCIVSVLACFLALTLPDPCLAQPWAKEMFETTRHDFGSVARGTKAEFEFKLTNPYIEDVEIGSATTSCGCTSVKIEKRVLKTYESTAIVAKFNTHLFLGKRGATITVNFSRPQRASVRLRVDGTIHSDLIVSPSSADLGAVPRGTPVERHLSVRYAGSQRLAIVGVKTENPHLKARIVPQGDVRRASYDLVVQLDADAPSGYIRDNLLLRTTNRQLREIPVMVEARVMPEVTVTPNTLFLGVLKPGDRVTKNVIVRASRPFTIKSIKADHDGVEFDASDSKLSRPIHVVAVTIVAGEEPGALVHKVTIETDGSTEKPSLNSYAVVQP